MKDQSMVRTISPAEELHNVAQDNAKKVGSMFVTPGIASGALVSKADLEDPQTSESATAELRSFVGTGM